MRYLLRQIFDHALTATDHAFIGDAHVFRY